MEKERWNERIFLLEAELKKIDARYLDLKPKDDGLKLTRKYDFELVKQEENILEIKLIDHVFFKPEGPFEITIEYLGTFRSEVNLPEKINKNILKRIAYPLLMHSVTLIANITERFGMVPLIIPPLSEGDEDGND